MKTARTLFFGQYWDEHHHAWAPCADTCPGKDTFDDAIKDCKKLRDSHPVYEDRRFRVERRYQETETYPLTMKVL